MISRSSGSSADSGSSTVSSTPIGSAPALARSFTVTWIASDPTSRVVPVIGSVESTSVSSAAILSAAQSSPTPAPSTTSGLPPRICRMTERFRTLSGTFPTFISKDPLSIAFLAF